MSPTIRITEVAPRDGLQNEPVRVPTARKAELIKRAERFRPTEIEITSFVSPKWIPQLGDAEPLCELLAGDKPAGMVYSALVPNQHGMDRLLATNEAAKAVTGRGPLIDKVSVFTAASETFNQRNTNASIAESIERFRPVIDSARAAGLLTRGYISCIVACPFEGGIRAEAALGVAEMLIDAGIHEIDLGDTIGAATPDSITSVLSAVLDRCGDRTRVGLHLHDTHGEAAACVRSALDLGIRDFDGSVAGLGGCPYASTPGRRAPGNISTELLVRTIEEAGYATGIDRRALTDASTFAKDLLEAADEANT